MLELTRRSISKLGAMPIVLLVRVVLFLNNLSFVIFSNIFYCAFNFFFNQLQLMSINILLTSIIFDHLLQLFFKLSSHSL